MFYPLRSSIEVQLSEDAGHWVQINRTDRFQSTRAHFTLFPLVTFVFKSRGNESLFAP